MKVGSYVKIKSASTNKMKRNLISLGKGSIVTGNESFDFKNKSITSNLFILKVKVDKDSSHFFNLKDEELDNYSKKVKLKFITIRSAKNIINSFIFSLYEEYANNLKIYQDMYNINYETFDNIFNKDSFSYNAIKKEIERIENVILNKSFNNKFLNKILKEQYQYNAIDKEKFLETFKEETKKIINDFHQLKEKMKELNFITCDECNNDMEYIDTRKAYFCSNEDCFHEVGFN